MLADQLDYVVGVDPHRDSHALAIVDVRTGAIVLEASVAASSSGNARALENRRAARAGTEGVRERRHGLVRRRPHAFPRRS